MCALGHLPPKGKAYGQCGTFRGGRVKVPSAHTGADEGKTGVYFGTLIIPEAFPSSGPFGTTFPQGKA